MPQVNHAVCYGLHGIVVDTMNFKSQQQTLELIFPGKYPLYRPKSFLEYFLTKSLFSTSLCLLALSLILGNIRNHAKIEKRFAIFTGVIIHRLNS
jgi:hypothetical protein